MSTRRIPTRGTIMIAECVLFSNHSSPNHCQMVWEFFTGLLLRFPPCSLWNVDLFLPSNSDSKDPTPRHIAWFRTTPLPMRTWNVYFSSPESHHMGWCQIWFFSTPRFDFSSIVHHENSGLSVLFSPSQILTRRMQPLEVGPSLFCTTPLPIYTRWYSFFFPQVSTAHCLAHLDFFTIPPLDFHSDFTMGSRSIPFFHHKSPTGEILLIALEYACFFRTTPLPMVVVDSEFFFPKLHHIVSARALF